jgi:hypothetical protein
MAYTDADGRMVNGIKRTRYTADAMVDLIIAEPGVSQGEIASYFGYSQAWVSIMINSDAFQGKLAERKAELVDPHIVASMENRIKAVAQLSLDKVLERLAGTPEDEFLIASAKLSTSALGYGAKVPGSGSGPQVIINLPGVVSSASEWALKHAQPTHLNLVEPKAATLPLTIDHEVELKPVR